MGILRRRPAPSYGGVALPPAQTLTPTWRQKGAGQRKVSAPVVMVPSGATNWRSVGSTTVALSPPGDERWTVKGGVFALERNGASQPNGGGAPGAAVGFNQALGTDALYTLSGYQTNLPFTQPLTVVSGTPLVLTYFTDNYEWNRNGLVVTMNLTVEIELEESPYPYGNVH